MVTFLIVYLHLYCMFTSILVTLKILPLNDYFNKVFSSKFKRRLFLSTCFVLPEFTFLFIIFLLFKEMFKGITHDFSEYLNY